MAVPVVKNVLVLEFNPIIESWGNQRLTALKNWNSPLQLEQAYIEDIHSVSGKVMNYHIVDRQVVDDIPIKFDGFDYTDETYLACLGNSQNCHQPDLVNYLDILNQFDVCGKRNRGEIDELWIWGGPYFGYWEAVMAGPNAFNTNAPPIIGSACAKDMHIMGFNYERGVPEMLEDMGHRVEGTMRHVYGSWQPVETHAWNRFTLRDIDISGQSGCGNVHYGPNSQSDYDWGNTRFVTSSCEDWGNYPNLTGEAENFNCVRWGCNGYQYKKWWLAHLPKYRGLAPDGKLNNWWDYVQDYREALNLQQCAGRSTSQICAPTAGDFCAWYLCAYDNTGGCFPRGTENTRACRQQVFLISDLRQLLQNYLGAADGQYQPVEGKINLLDAAFVMNQASR